MEGLDKSNLKQDIIDSPKQLTADLEFFNQLNIARRQFDKIILCGMGGSAIAVDILNYFKINYYDSLSLGIPVIAHRDYDLPAGTNENSLIICASYSGNTEEALSSFEKAKKNGLEITGLACGGQLADLFEKHKTPWIKIPGAKIQPRHGLYFQLNALIKLFVAYGLLLHTAQDLIHFAAAAINPAETEKIAEPLAKKLLNKIPIVYASRNNEAVARVMKIKFNEDAKIPSFYDYFPELNHNEMNGWEKPLGPFHFIFLTDKNDHPRVQKRMRITAELLEKFGLPCDMIALEGQDALEKLFWSLTLGDWLAYNLALAYNIDPTPVRLVEELKAKMRQ